VASMTSTPIRNVEPDSASRDLASLGKEVKIEGKIYSAQDLHIDGEVAGTIELPDHRLTVGLSASIKAEIRAREIIILGSVQGNAHARDKFEIHKGATFIGDVKTARMIVEDGAYIKGSIDIVRAEAIKTRDKPQTTALEQPGIPVAPSFQATLPN
jgi:cytoskeletal protein CcmA (bactofilin family)